MVDLCAWGQNEAGAGRGGWRYAWNYGDSDNSVTQWPVIGLEAAETNWGISAPAFVKSELDIWLTYSQNANGGFGYESPWNWVNVAKTGAGIAGLNYIGLSSTNSRVVNAINYLNSTWGTSGTDGYWGNYYALYAVMKGMATARPSPITHIGAHDWYTEFAQNLVNAQQSGGNWPSGGYGDTILNTGWALLILSPTVFTPPPVANAGPDVVGGVHPEYPAVTLDGSRSYHLNPERRIVAYRWDFGDGTPPYTETGGNAPDGRFDGITTHAYTALGQYNATLTVTDDDPTAPQSASDTALVRITLPDHPPVAVPGGPYVGYVSIPLTLDGSHSYDINQKDGDAITQYGWEIDGVYPYDFDDAFGPTVQWTPPAPGTYNIGLRVTDTPGLFADSPKSHEAWTTVQVGNEPFISLVAVSTEVAMNERTHLVVDVFDASMPPSPRSLTVRLRQSSSINTAPSGRSLNIQFCQDNQCHPITDVLVDTQMTGAGWQAHYDFDITRNWDWIEPLTLQKTLGEVLIKVLVRLAPADPFNKAMFTAFLLNKYFDNENNITLTYANDSQDVVDPLHKLPVSVTYSVPESKQNWLFTSFATSIASSLATESAPLWIYFGPWGPAAAYATEVALWLTAKGAYQAAHDPDPNFDETVLPVPIEAPELDPVPPGAPRSAALAALEFLSLQQAATRCFLKAEGAREAGAWNWVAIQLSDSRKYAIQSLDALVQLRTYYGEATSGLTPLTTQQIEDFKADLVANGLPPEEVSFLTRLGLTQEEQNDLRDLLVGLPTDFIKEKGFGGINESLDTTADSLGSLCANLLEEETTIRVHELGGTVSSPTPEELAMLDALHTQVETGLSVGIRSNELHEAIVSLRTMAEQVLARTNNLDVVLPYYEFAMSAQARFQQLPVAQMPKLTLAKSANPTTYSYPGQVIVYTYVATNTGDVTLSGPFAVTDDKLGTFQCGTATSLAPNASVTCTKSYTIQASDLNATNNASITNHATASGTFGGNTVTSNQAQATINQVPPSAKITPTNTTCQQFADGTAQDLTDEFYNVQSGKISSVAPGVFFYYSKITAPASSFQIQVQQSNTNGWKPLAIQKVGQVIVWDNNCLKSNATATYNGTTGMVTIQVGGATVGAVYYLSVKYDPGSLVGTSVSKPYPAATYTYVTYINGAAIIPSWDSVNVKPK
jgi:hypothetical protein